MTEIYDNMATKSGHLGQFKERAVIKLFFFSCWLLLINTAFDYLDFYFLISCIDNVHYVQSNQLILLHLYINPNNHK